MLGFKKVGHLNYPKERCAVENKLKRMKELFPARNPAKIRLYGGFDDDLEVRFHKQLKEAFVGEKEPDGIIILIDSPGGGSKGSLEYHQLTPET